MDCEEGSGDTRSAVPFGVGRRGVDALEIARGVLADRADEVLGQLLALEEVAADIVHPYLQSSASLADPAPRLRCRDNARRYSAQKAVRTSA